jgi:hypothetical protein
MDATIRDAAKKSLETARITSRPERPLHLAPELHRLRRRVVFDVVPADRLARGDRALELHLVREPDRSAPRAAESEAAMSFPHTV